MMGKRGMWPKLAAAAVMLAAVATARAQDRELPEQPEAKAPTGAADAVRAERALLKNPKDRATRMRAAREHLAAGADNRSNVDAAQGRAVEVLKDNPNDVEALLLAGQTSLLKGDVSAATRYFRAALANDPNNASAELALGDALTRLGDEAGANAAFARYRALKGMPALKSDTERR